jgi:hypothetical protein
MPQQPEAIIAEGETQLAKFDAAFERAHAVTQKQVERLTGRKEPKPLHTIKSTFDGAEREFGIDRRYFPILEGGLGRSAYAALKDFTGGRWQFNDVAVVLSVALHGPSQAEKQRLNMLQDAARFGMPPIPVGHTPHPDVVRVLQETGHGNYAELAAEILAAAIFGNTEAADDAA